MPRQADTRVGDLLLALLSLLLGLTVWAIVKQRDTEMTIKSIPVRPVNDPRDLYCDFEPKFIQVRFSYPRYAEEVVSGENFWFELDLGELRNKAGVETAVRDSHRFFPDEVKRSPGTPPQVRALELVGTYTINYTTQVYTVEATVKPRFAGEPKAGFELRPGRVRTSPEKILLTVERPPGPAMPPGAPARIDASTKPISLAGKSGLVAETVELDLPPSMHPLPNRPGKTIQVAVELAEATQRREFPGIAFNYVPLNRHVRAVFDPPAVSVFVAVPASLAGALKPADIRLVPQGLPKEEAGAEAEVTFTVSLDAVDAATRARIESVEAVPATVKVRFEGKPGND